MTLQRPISLTFPYYFTVGASTSTFCVVTAIVLSYAVSLLLHTLYALPQSSPILGRCNTLLAFSTTMPTTQWLTMIHKLTNSTVHTNWLLVPLVTTMCHTTSLRPSTTNLFDVDDSIASLAQDSLASARSQALLPVVDRQWDLRSTTSTDDSAIKWPR